MLRILIMSLKLCRPTSAEIWNCIIQLPVWRVFTVSMKLKLIRIVRVKLVPSTVFSMEKNLTNTGTLFVFSCLFPSRFVREGFFLQTILTTCHGYSDHYRRYRFNRESAFQIP